jgi:hypothetical protein
VHGYRATVEARLGRWQAAEACLDQADQVVRSPKQQALSNVERARVLAAGRKIEPACELAVAALDAGVAYGSERVVRSVADFQVQLRRTGSATAELDERLHRVYRHDL